MKYTIKTELDNITQLKNGTFSYDEKIISTKWEVRDYYKWKNKFLDPDFGPDQLKDSPLESKEEKDHRNDWKGLV